MKFYFKLYIYCLLLTVCGCKKFVEIDPPTTMLVTNSIFNSSGTATAAVLSIYQQMQGASFQIAQSCGLLSDELANDYSSDVTLRQYYTNSMLATNGGVGFWPSAYKYIYQANAIIEALQKSNKLIPSIKNQLLGESKFIRAFWYFYLAACYGDVPKVIGTDYTYNAGLARAPKPEIFQQIVTDLIDARSLLNSNFVDGTDTAIAADRVRPTSWAAEALLARVYLYTGDYVNAEKEATNVINNGSLFHMEGDLNSVFLANSNEAIWQLAVPIPTDVNTEDGNNFILVSTPSTGNASTNTISQQLLNAFEIGDKRKDNWVGKIIVSADTFLFPYKYKVQYSDNVTEYTMVLRLAEQFLIRAEARAQINTDLTGAVADLDTIRIRAGLDGYKGVLDKPSLLDAILHERQVELFTEWGNRWFDLIRTGNANSVMSTVSPLKGGAWDSNKQLFPIPQSEIILDINLSQNTGY